jgi:ferredoxin
VKLAVDLGRCTGHGRCYTLAPNVFEADDEGHSVLLAAEVPAAHEREARAAAVNSPEYAIAIIEG